MEILLPRMKYTHEIVGTHGGALLPERAPGAKSLVCIGAFRVMLHEPIRNDVFNATQRCNIVATLFRMVTTLFQHCNAVLR